MTQPPESVVCDSHCHFFSSAFLRALGREAGRAAETPDALAASIGWDPPGTDEMLADRWIQELDRHGVARAMLIASVGGDERSVAAAVARHPSRFVGAFMFNPAAGDVAARLDRAFGELKLRTVCLFPAMHGYAIDDGVVREVFELAERHAAVVFVHCGVLTVGARRKLGLPSRFDLRRGDPLAVGAIAARHPSVPVIVPHFGAGFFREALMAARQASNILLDSSSSNGWIDLHPGLTLREVFARTIAVVGPERLLFGTDSSFFPRGWQRPVADTQRAILGDLGVDPAPILGGNFARLFGSS